MSVKNKVKALELASLDSAAFDGTLQPFNAGLEAASFMIRIINDSDRDITVSYDGTTDNDFVRAGDTLQLPAQSNSQPNNFIANFHKGMIIYVSGAAGGTGLVYLAGYYQD